ncbi:hypothetical protein HUG17_7828 [Dermatophagoides farinae]|uniref:Uncharacterized protein n=1 Tax=Dermatophagoides farinae TaxID=6954 RepID=A0A9D4NWN9_DERFA|nr:hypothetical protein HUG17_7828 [Dermatophagoides farinae]
MVIWVQNDPTIPIQKGLQCDGKDSHISFFRNLYKFNGDITVPWIIMNSCAFDDDLKRILLNPNSDCQL